jgi:hypothetical protein
MEDGTSLNSGSAMAFCSSFACVFGDSLTHAAQVGLEFPILLPWAPEFWDYRHASPRLASAMF